MVFSAETLSLLRYADEVERLVALFPRAELSAVLFVRDRAEYLHSYGWAMQMLAQKLSGDPDSILYVQRDSWLVDYEARVNLWRRALGRGHVQVLDYETCMRESGSVVPAFFETLGIGRVGVQGLGEYFLNARPAE